MADFYDVNKYIDKYIFGGSVVSKDFFMKEDKNNTDRNWVIAQLRWKQVKDSCPYPNRDMLFERAERLEDILEGTGVAKPKLNQETINNGLNRVDSEKGSCKSDDWTMVQVLMLLFWEHGEEFGESFGLNVKSLRNKAASARGGDLWKIVDVLYKRVRGGRGE